MNKWTTGRIGELNGKRIVITGSSHGIGFEAAGILASKGAEVVLAVRNREKGEKAAVKIRPLNGSKPVTVMNLDLADLESVRKFAEEYATRFDRLDVLINNAGVMIPPYKMTKDGFELQFGTNHLGHFALTGHLLPVVMNTPLSRIVTISSIAARRAKIHFDNLDGSKGYNPMTFYRQSKLANLLFAMELQNRLEVAGSTTISVACHPGISVTNLLSRGTGRETGRVMKALMGIVAQPASMGALPTLYAATHPDLRGGEFIGPDGPGNTKGYPVLTNDAARLYKPDLAAKLWEVSETLTGVRYSI
ncbi:MAG: oxidoreductase [Bacteroidales bacterium]|jgi:NAD(P)-dependent dehydrogenase (short-subunit alcohol dehydrogenase family)|nr:oxidoreductase [Bacteroidales bacterium]HNX84646.1 oxidoreductase [Bacteroidales bacterium]HOC48688.1 oxidoreductase [Bacteroidales bacterium]HPS98361.1 oxidoreductase [Bacteroidales bacterium]